MRLPSWVPRLNAIRSRDDQEYTSDQAAIDAKLAPFWGQKHPQMPPDPRALDVVRLAALRNRLLDKYAYRWRDVEAIDEIVDALFDPVVQSDGTYFALGTNRIYLNKEGHSPNPRFRTIPDEFKEHYYITVRSLRLGKFLTSYEEAVRLFNNVLPDWGFTARVTPTGTTVRLEYGDERTEWVGGATIATLIIVAMLDLLAQQPHRAKPWRSI